MKPATTLDLSGNLFPPVTYFPFPTLVPNRLTLHGIGPMALEQLRELAACAGEGPDSVQVTVEATPELSNDPDAETSVIVEGGLTLSRTVLVISDDLTHKVVTWGATVSGLTFHASADGKVYADGPDARVILHDPANQRHGGKPLTSTVWEREQEYERHVDNLIDALRDSFRRAHAGAGKSKRYESYAALVEARNEARMRGGRYGLAPDSIASLLSMAPMIGKERSRTTVVNAVDRIEPDGLMTRRVGKRYTMRLDEATAKRLHGEKAESKQAVLRYDVDVEAEEEDVGMAAMQLLREMDTEALLVVTGVLMNAYDTGNRAQRIGAADLARIRGMELARGSVKRRFSAMSDLLRDVVIEVRPVSAKADGTYARLPLFVNQGEVVVAGGHRLPLVNLNDAMYRAMQAKGHGVMFDRRMLTVDLNTHEWAFRIGYALFVQWSLGWVMNGYANGKRLRRSMRQLLADAGIPYDIDAERRKRGAATVRQKIESSLDGLVSLRSDLKSWKRTKQAADPADDVYEFVPSDAYADRLTRHRHPALAEPAKAEALPPPPTKRQRRKRT